MRTHLEIWPAARVPGMGLLASDLRLYARHQRADVGWVMRSRAPCECPISGRRLCRIAWRTGAWRGPVRRSARMLDVTGVSRHAFPSSPSPTERDDHTGEGGTEGKGVGEASRQSLSDVGFSHVQSPSPTNRRPSGAFGHPRRGRCGQGTCHSGRRCSRPACFSTSPSCCRCASGRKSCGPARPS